MALFLLLGALLLWLSFDRAVWRDRGQWPAIGAALLGLLLLARGRPVTGIVLIGGGALWSRRPRRKHSPQQQLDRLACAEASDLLGVAVDADRATILAAHRRLIARNHPDNGGTQGLAARLNAARDTLLRARPD